MEQKGLDSNVGLTGGQLSLFVTYSFPNKLSFILGNLRNMHSLGGNNTLKTFANRYLRQLNRSSNWKMNPDLDFTKDKKWLSFLENILYYTKQSSKKKKGTIFIWVNIKFMFSNNPLFYKPYHLVLK